MTKIFISVILLATLTGCAATRVALEHRNLDVQTKMSKTIFLDPVAPSQKTVFVDIRNTSDKSLNLSKAIRANISSHGYEIVSDPSHAHYLLQANVLSAEKMSQSAAHAALNGGYGSVLSGVATGAALGGFSNNGKGILAGGIIGGIASTVADSVVKDVNFVMITDIQIAERVNGDVKVNQTTKSVLNNGTATKTVQTSQAQSSFKKYRTRVVSTADKVNLHFAEAKPVLEKGLIKAISGIF